MTTDSGFNSRLQVALGRETPYALAKRTGISEGLLRKYLSGTTIPSLDRGAELAKAIGVTLGWLATGEGPMRPGEGGEGCPEMVFEVWRACEDFLAQEGIKVRDLSKFRELVKAICILVAKQKADSAKVVDLSQFRDFIRLVG